jgi:hypothetical protein
MLLDLYTVVATVELSIEYGTGKEFLRLTPRVQVYLSSTAAGAVPKVYGRFSRSSRDATSARCHLSACMSASSGAATRRVTSATSVVPTHTHTLPGTRPGTGRARDYPVPFLQLHYIQRDITVSHCPSRLHGYVLLLRLFAAALLAGDPGRGGVASRHPNPFPEGAIPPLCAQMSPITAASLSGTTCAHVCDHPPPCCRCRRRCRRRCRMVL